MLGHTRLTDAALFNSNHTVFYQHLSLVTNYIYSVLDHVCSQPTGVVSHVKRTLVRRRDMCSAIVSPAPPPAPRHRTSRHVRTLYPPTAFTIHRTITLPIPTSAPPSPPLPLSNNKTHRCYSLFRAEVAVAFCNSEVQICSPQRVMAHRPVTTCNRTRVRTRDLLVVQASEPVDQNDLYIPCHHHPHHYKPSHYLYHC